MKALAPRLLATVALSLLLASSALPSQVWANGKKDDKPAENTQYVAVSPVAIPVIVRGVVVNYIFVTVRLELTASANSAKAREKEPYFRDAIIRAAHRSPFVKPGDYIHVDEAKLIATLFKDAQAIAGPGIVKSVTIVAQQPKSYQVSAPS